MVWPTPFAEASGSAFVLDNRSGMFYEAKSDFYYDPKTRLYFNNNNRTYYTYNVETKRFQRTEKSGDAPGPTDTTDLVPIMDTTHVSKTMESVKTISIKLTTKTSRKQVQKLSTESSDAMKVARKHAVDMEKWSVRQSEKTKQSTNQEKVIRTVKGNPVCLVCRRKFKSLEVLRRHEASSKLHQTNLDKARSVKGLGKYADRAQQRRAQHDDFESVISEQTTTHAEGSIPVTRKVDQQEGSAKIGETMLKKMGWKPTEKDDPSDSRLKREWSRIEAIAAGGKDDVARSKNGLGANHR